jgi:pimeloyl-ACP methyl ester carboxylesterase
MKKPRPNHRILDFQNTQNGTYIWIPGWGGNSWTLLPLVESMAKGRHILMDPLSRKDLESVGLRGRDLSIELMAESVLKVLESEEGPWHIIGISMGGLVAQVLADSLPVEMATLHLCCTSTGGANEQDAVDQSALQAWWRPCVPGEDPITKILKCCFSPSFQKDSRFQDYLAHLRKNPSPVSGSTLKLQWQAALAFDGLPYLDRVQWPVYIYEGRQDKVVRKEVSRRLERALRVPPKVEVFSGGHLFFMESPLEFCKILLRNSAG